VPHSSRSTWHTSPTVARARRAARIGTSRFASPVAAARTSARADSTSPESRASRTAALRAGRDSAEVESALAEVRAAAEGDANLLVPMRAALRAQATVGEVCQVLRDE